jgi:antirestriction protein ArdC
MTKTEMQAEALENARNGQSVMNYAAIYSGFAAKGIAESDIQPRENVLTFHAWKALGRSVKKGEHGVKVVTFVSCSITEKDASGQEQAVSYRRPHTTTVFHISQTEPTSEREARHRDKPRQWSGRRLYDRAGNARGDYIVPDPGELAADRWNETHS